VTPRKRLFGILTYGFVLLGIGISAYAVAWPSIAEDLGRSLAELGLVSLAFGLGYTASTATSGAMVDRFGMGRLLIGSAIAMVIALVGVATSPSWLLFLMAMGLVGYGGGSIDAVTNSYVAVRRGASSMGLLHGMFGIGAIMGPLIVTTLLAVGSSWRVAFASLAVAETVYVIGLIFFARGVDLPSRSSEGSRVPLPVSAPLVWSIAVFLAYASMAVGVSVWAFTFVNEGRGIDTTSAGLIIAAYWASFTAARFVLGWVGDRVAPARVLRWSAVATVACLTVFWWNPTDWLGIAALIATGFAHGPIFPLEMVVTPRRFGAALTATVIGFEIAAANIGGATAPAVIGVLVDRFGLSAVPPTLVMSSVVLLVTVEMLGRTTRGLDHPATK
jgi:fucose permease